jgi:hypothetical protein
VNRSDRRLMKALVAYWAGQGLPVRARSALAYARCRTVEQVRALGRAYFAALENCGAVTLGQIERATGGWTNGEEQERVYAAAFWVLTRGNQCQGVSTTSCSPSRSGCWDPMSARCLKNGWLPPAISQEHISAGDGRMPLHCTGGS